jgi:beta-glucanase (GH16 family)
LPQGLRERPRLFAALAAAAALCLVVIGLVVSSSGSSSSPGSAAGSIQPSSASMPGAGPVPSVPAGYTQVFLDNFGGPAGSPPSELNWLYDIGSGWGNSSVDHDTNSTSNIYLDGHGDLVIQANENHGKWTSGRIESTRADFTAPAGGRLEMTASVEQPNVANGTGYWPAFWALGASERTGGEWPQIGELDMFEDVNGDNKASQTLHDGGPTETHPLISCPVATCQTSFNTYSVIVDRTNPNAESLEFLMDGTVEKTVTEAEVGTADWKAAIDHGFYILLDLAMGGNYPDSDCNCTGPTSSTTSGGQMKVAYVAVYEQGGNSTPTATAKATGPVTGFQNECLANTNSLNTASNEVVLTKCDGGAGQVWSTYSDGTLRAQGGCLDVDGGEQSAGTQAVWYPCTSEQSQVWQLKSNGELYNPFSGLCLTNPGNDTDTGLTIESCAGSPQQQWHLPT